MNTGYKAGVSVDERYVGWISNSIYRERDQSKESEMYSEGPGQ